MPSIRVSAGPGDVPDQATNHRAGCRPGHRQTGGVSQRQAPASVQHVAVMLLAPFFSGAEHQTLALCRYLDRRCRVTLLANDELADLLVTDPFLREYAGSLQVQRLGRAFPAAGARTVRGALQRGLMYPHLQFNAWRALRRLQPSVVHLVLAPTFFAYAPLFHVLSLPAVLTLSGEMRYARHFYGPAKRAAVRYAVTQATALVVCSADEMANLRCVVPSGAAHATLLDNFTDVARFRPAAVKVPLVTFAARLHPEKGALLYLDAVAQISRAYSHVRFALMGKGELSAAVEQRTHELGLQGVVERGFATDLAPHLARSSIFVSCQRYENLGSSSLLEAMACGNAIVATDVGQTWRIVDETVGTRVPADAAGLARALSALLDDPQKTASLGRAARQRVEAQYHPGAYVDALLRIYATAIAER